MEGLHCRATLFTFEDNKVRKEVWAAVCGPAVDHAKVLAQLPRCTIGAVEGGARTLKIESCSGVQCSMSYMQAGQEIHHGCL